MDSYTPSDEDDSGEILLSKTALLQAPHAIEWPILGHLSEETDCANENASSASSE